MSAQPSLVAVTDTRPISSVVFVTPEMAERWLGRNFNNRNLVDKDVQSYARDMAAGRWDLNGESLKFAADGTLLDGQHRLSAVIKANATVPMFVVRGLSNSTQDSMDTGRKRSAADMLTIHGEKHCQIIAAAVRIAVGTQDRQPIQKVKVSHAQVADFLSAHPELRDAAAHASNLYRDTDCPPSVVAYTLWRLSQIDPNAALDFWTAASTKVDLAEGDPVLGLVHKFAEVRRNRQKLTVEMQLSLVYRAWNARRAGQSMRIFRINSPGGIVPIPEPR